MWQIPPQNLKLTSNDIHIWQVNLALSPEEIEPLIKILSEDEILRANRFHFEQHRRRFLVARSHLRIILGRYLQIEPQQLKFDYNSRGKPYLANQNNSQIIQFNLSHSQELALYGLTINHLIGVDLEYIRPIDDAESIAKRFFSPQESQLISTLSPENKIRVFFQLWTAKEAYLKATGDGLGGGLDQVEIEITSDNLLRLFSIQKNLQKANDWFLYSFIPISNYIAAIAIENCKQDRGILENYEDKILLFQM